MRLVLRPDLYVRKDSPEAAARGYSVNFGVVLRGGRARFLAGPDERGLLVLDDVHPRFLIAAGLDIQQVRVDGPEVEALD
jgi:hypothetical protein